MLGCCVVDVVWRSGLFVWVVLRFLVLEFTAVWVLVGFVLVRLCSWLCGVCLEFGFWCSRNTGSVVFVWFWVFGGLGDLRTAVD